MPSIIQQSLPKTYTRNIAHLFHRHFDLLNNRPTLRHAQSPCQCTIASVSRQSHTYLVRQTTHLMYDHSHAQTIAHLSGAPYLHLMRDHLRAQVIARLSGAPYHPLNARSLACSKQSHASSTRPVALLMHNHSCAQSIAHLFGASSHTFTLTLPSQSACQCTITSVPQHNRTPIRCALSPCQSTIASVPKTILHLFAVPSHPPVQSPYLIHSLPCLF